MTTTSSIKQIDKHFSEKELAQDNINNSIIDDHLIFLYPLVRNLRESSNIHNIQEYEEKEMAEQLQNQDLD